MFKFIIRCCEPSEVQDSSSKRSVGPAIQGANNFGEESEAKLTQESEVNSASLRVDHRHLQQQVRISLCAQPGG
jgi:hypothetical protein